MLILKKRPKPQWWMSIPAIVFTPLELVVDGGFGGTGPTGNATNPTGNFGSGNYAIVGGQGRCTNGAATQGYIYIDIPAIVGRTYSASVDVVAGTSGASCAWWIQQTDGTNVATGAGAGTKTATVTATGAGVRFHFSPGTATSGHTMFFDNMSLKLNGAAETALVFAHAKALGVTGIRTDLQGEWVFWGSSSGRFWTDPDNVVNAAIANGIEVAFCETSTPSWAGATTGTYPTTQLSAFATCLQDAASRYRGYVKLWEIRNEQNLAGFSQNVTNGDSAAACATAYTTYAKAIATAIRTGNPQAKIISNGLSPSPSTVLGSYIQADTFLAQMYANGAKGVFDYIGFHPYSRPLQPTDPASYNGWEIMERGIRQAMAANGEGHKKIFATEFGFPTGGTSSGEQTTEANTGAGIITAAHLAKTDKYLQAICYYSDTDRHGAGFGSTTNEDYYGIYAASLAAKAAPAAALQYATRVL